MARFEGRSVYEDVAVATTVITRFRFVRLNGSRQAIQLAGPTTSRQDVGIALESYDPAAPSKHKGFAYRLVGTALVEAAGVIAAGAKVSVDATGRAVVDGVTAANNIFTAETGATAAGQLITVRVNGL